MRKREERELVDLGINCIVMDIRERMMNHFKNTPMQTGSNYVRWNTLDRPDMNHNYQRRQWDSQQHRRLLVNYEPLLQVQLHPKTVTFYTQVLGRSEEYKQIHTQLQAFFKKYLGSVELKENDSFGSRYSDGSGDKAKILEIAKRYDDSDIEHDVPVEEPRLEQPQYGYSIFGTPEMTDTQRRYVEQMYNQIHRDREIDWSSVQTVEIPTVEYSQNIDVSDNGVIRSRLTINNSEWVI